MITLRRVLIVGAGLAGISTAEALREAGFAGDLTLVGAEVDMPYDRPPLSKQVLVGTWEPDRAGLRTADDLARLDAHLMLGTNVGRVRPDRCEVEVRGVGGLRYDALVIATGVRPRRLGYENLPHGVHVLRTLADAVALRRDLLDGGDLVIVGAGFVGLEVASSARAMGLGVTVVDSVQWPLAGRLGQPIGRFIQRLHETHDVDLRCGDGLDRLVVEDGRVRGVRLRSGTLLPASTVVLAVGAVPNVEFLDGSGLDTSDGVVCDAHLRAAPSIYAVGDVANWPRPDGRRARLEHHGNAVQQARTVAHNLLHPDQPETYAAVPYVWSDQFGLRLQSHGWLSPEDDVALLHLDHDEKSLVEAHGRGGRVSGVVGFNAARQVRAILPLLGSPWSDLPSHREMVDTERLLSYTSR